jgi:predicted kinase
MLTIMCGIPRSGKSTWVKNNKGDAIVISPDEIRREFFGHQFHQNAEKFIWGITENVIRLLLKQEKNVILDATCMTTQSRYSWVKMVQEYNTTMSVVWTYADKDRDKNLAICKKRNALSPKDEQVPESVLESMSSFFIDPYEDWGGFTIIEFHNS